MTLLGTTALVAAQLMPLARTMRDFVLRMTLAAAAPALVRKSVLEQVLGEEWARVEAARQRGASMTSCLMAALAIAAREAPSSLACSHTRAHTSPELTTHAQT